MVYFNYQHCFLCGGESNQGQFVSPNALRSALPHSYNINIIKTNSDTTCGAIIGMDRHVALGHVLARKQHTYIMYYYYCKEVDVGSSRCMEEEKG